MFNESRTAKTMGLEYSKRRIPNRRLDMIVRDIAALLSSRAGRRKGNF
jgi:hypothetical protein